MATSRLVDQVARNLWRKGLVSQAALMGLPFKSSGQAAEDKSNLPASLLAPMALASRIPRERMWLMTNGASHRALCLHYSDSRLSISLRDSMDSFLFNFCVALHP